MKLLFNYYYQVGTIATTDNVVAAHTKPPSHPFMSIKICHSSATPSYYVIAYIAPIGADATFLVVVND